MKLLTSVILLGLLVLAGCSQEADNSNEAVQQAIVTYLGSVAGLDVSQMDIEVTSVSFRDNEADATVSFRPKGSTDPATGMQMSYTLERQGSRWVVKNRVESGSSHSGTMGGGMMGGDTPPVAMPPDHPPMGEMPMGEAAPPGETQ